MLTKILLNQWAQKQNVSNEVELLNRASHKMKMQNLGHHTTACFDMRESKFMSKYR